GPGRGEPKGRLQRLAEFDLRQKPRCLLPAKSGRVPGHQRPLNELSRFAGHLANRSRARTRL
ncbi:MAG: hypothetical protein AVDCRST_MAG51-1184, partial [uncultured Ramlibacter sp.]